MARFHSVDEVVEHLTRAEGGRRRVVGIAGPPGAGKSTIAEATVRSIPSAALLPMDGYHYPQARLRELGRRDRMGAPDTFDVDAFVAVLEAVRQPGGAVSARDFDREIEEPVENGIKIAAESRTIVVEGNYLLLRSGGWERVAPLLDETFFIELDNDERLERLIARHLRFGKNAQDARDWALGPDEANARLITATAELADHVIALDGGR